MSSVGSKSTTNLHPAAAGFLLCDGGAGSSGGGAEEQRHGTVALHSSWITRLHRHPPPPTSFRPPPPLRPLQSSGDDVMVHTAHYRDIEPTRESRTGDRFWPNPNRSSLLIHRYLGFFRGRPPPVAAEQGCRLDREETGGGGDLRGNYSVTTGFGPLRFRTSSIGTGRNHPFHSHHHHPREGKPNWQNLIEDRGCFPLFREMVRSGGIKGREEDTGWAGAPSGEKQLKSVGYDWRWQRRTPGDRSCGNFCFSPSVGISGYLGGGREGSSIKTMQHSRWVFGDLPRKHANSCPTSSSSLQNLLQVPPAGRGIATSPELMQTYHPREHFIDEARERISLGPGNPKSTIGGSALYENTDDAATRRILQDTPLSKQDTVQQPYDRRATTLLGEPEEPFSPWNMGRFKRRDTTLPLHKGGDRKRCPETDGIVPSKSRKLTTEG